MSTGLVHRRALLKGGLAVGAALALVGVAQLPASAPGRLALSERESEIVAAVAEVLFPGAPFPISGVDAGVVAEVDRIVDDCIPEVGATLFRYLLRALEWGTLAARGVRFSDLDLETRREVLEVWHQPNLLPRKIAWDAMRMILAMAYFSHPAVLAHMEWRATCSGGVA